MAVCIKIYWLIIRYLFPVELWMFHLFDIWFFIICHAFIWFDCFFFLLTWCNLNECLLLYVLDLNNFFGCDICAAAKNSLDSMAELLIIGWNCILVDTIVDYPFYYLVWNNCQMETLLKLIVTSCHTLFTLISYI